MMDTSAIIDKVRKLLALSKSNNEHEAQAAVAKANALLDQHRLSMADVCDTDVEEAIEEDEESVYFSKSITPWKQELLQVLSHHYGLATIIYYKNTYNGNWNRRRESHFKFIGRRSDIQIAKYMYAWLSAECTRLVGLQARGQGRVYVSSWCRGFVEGVHQKLESSREEVKKTATTSAIVKIDSRGEEAHAFMKMMHENLGSRDVSSNAYIDRHAFRTGLERGRQVHVGQGLTEATEGSKLLR